MVPVPPSCAQIATGEDNAKERKITSFSGDRTRSFPFLVSGYARYSWQGFDCIFGLQMNFAFAVSPCALIPGEGLVLEEHSTNSSWLRPPTGVSLHEV
jgi:hypothetical protein